MTQNPQNGETDSKTADRLDCALRDCFISQRETYGDGEPSNMVGAILGSGRMISGSLSEVAQALNRIAEAIESRD